MNHQFDKTYEERWGGIEQADLSRGIPQCQWIAPREYDVGHLNCGRKDGHDGPHMDCYGFYHEKWTRE